MPVTSPRRRAVCSRIQMTWVGVNSGWRASSTAAAALTCGAANDVPSTVPSAWIVDPGGASSDEPVGRERARHGRDDADARRGDVVEDRIGVRERRPGQRRIDGRDADDVAQRGRPAGVDARVVRRVADGRDDDRPALDGVGDRVALGARELVQARILGIAIAAQREVDHARAGAHGVADGTGLDLGIDVAAADHAVVEQLDVRRADADPADAVVGIGRDDARDRRAVHERGGRIVGLVDRRERHGAREVGARAVDAAVDHGHRDRGVRRRRAARPRSRRR